MKASFLPITLDEYVDLPMKSNPSESGEEITIAQESTLEAYKRGVKYLVCRNPIWIIGSAFGSNLCFTCISVDTMLEDDYEIDEAFC